MTENKEHFYYLTEFNMNYHKITDNSIQSLYLKNILKENLFIYKNFEGTQLYFLTFYKLVRNKVMLFCNHLNSDKIII